MDLLIQELEWGLRNNMNENKKFTYIDSEFNEHSIDINKDDFKQINVDKKNFERKFESKPTTFFKDAMRRFVKNKSSVVGGVILGIIVLLSFVLPFTLQSDISSAHLDQRFLAPKLFNTGTGFWDGTIYYGEDIVYDRTNETPAGYVKDAVSELYTWDSKTNNSSTYATGGYLRFAVDPVASATADLEKNTKYLESYKFSLDLSKNYSFAFELSDEDTNDQFEQGYYKSYIKFKANVDDENYTYYYFNSDFVKATKDNSYDVSSLLKSAGYSGTFSTANFGFCIKPSYDLRQEILIKSITVSTSDELQSDLFKEMSFSDANKQVLMTQKDATTKEDNKGYWVCNGFKFLYQADVTFCHFRYDTYTAIYGIKDMTLASDVVKGFVKKGYLKYDFNVGIDSFEILDAEKCPITKVYSQTKNTGVITTYSLECEVSYYKYLGFDAMPKYLFGTDSNGKDLLHIMFNGLRISLLLGLITSAINLTIGVIWGSVSGYFGGWTDLLMERFTDILGRIPWIVVMTLCILYLGQNFTTFAIALCLTGWMGAAGTTRAQFYRFKGREYVLASRTLGSSDWRLIFKHILPNSLGTLVTSSVFMIPGVIYTEATLSYLNLGLQGLDSFGIILSENQQYISSNSYLILIPSLVMALMMISFNLFGNGLRDAFNPSLKGGE